MLKEKYDTPKLVNTYKQYDYNNELINNYLKILIQEFNQYYERILKVIDTKDATEWKAIKHKIITHVSSLELDQVGVLFKNDIDKISEESTQNLINNIRYILCYLRFEQFVNLLD
jgi:hypothetical protein